MTDNNKHLTLESGNPGSRNYGKDFDYTDACICAIADHGVLSKEGQPAAAKLYNHGTWKVAIIANEDPGIIGHLLPSGLKQQFNHPDVDPSPFPVDVQVRTRDALQYWKPGQEVNFVNLDQSPDFVLVAFRNDAASDDVAGGFATYPDNDSEDICARENGTTGPHVVAVNMTPQGNNMTSEGFNTKLIHEFGHNLGLMHPEIAYDEASKLGKCSLTESFAVSALGKMSTMAQMLLDNTNTAVDDAYRSKLQETISP
jgi:hypothetical protein